MSRLAPSCHGRADSHAERKKKASEAKAKQKLPYQILRMARDSANDIMTRENLIRFQDTYAETMERFGLERGIRGAKSAR